MAAAAMNVSAAFSIYVAEQYRKEKDMEQTVQQLKHEIEKASAVLIGAGAGLSASAGLTYSGKRFEENFADFQKKYGVKDMYSLGFSPFSSPEEKWAYWSRHIYLNRYQDPPEPVYQDLLELVRNKNYFVLTTNVDHCFQKAGFDKERLFYTQGDMGLWQCSRPCHKRTYDNERIVAQMVKEQKDMRIPSDLIPYCPICGAPMTMNLRVDETFVEDEGWHEAQRRYRTFVERNLNEQILFLELGVGGNTPVVIKYPFWKLTYQNPRAVYACVNDGEAFAPEEIASRSICLNGDIGNILKLLF